MSTDGKTGCLWCGRVSEYGNWRPSYELESCVIHNPLLVDLLRDMDLMCMGIGGEERRRKRIAEYDRIVQERERADREAVSRFKLDYGLEWWEIRAVMGVLE